jgi:glycosyltransferase involved in cell wall biosynthesis
VARVLWLSNETPDVAGQGGQRRQYFQIRELVEAGHEVAVGSLSGPQDDTSIRALAPVSRLPAPWHRWSRLGFGRARRPELSAFLSRSADRVVVAHTESWWTFRHHLLDMDAPVLVDMHNVLSEWYARGRRALASSRWARVEREIAAHAQAVSVCSERERAALDRVVGTVGPSRMFVLPHGVDPAAWTSAVPLADEPVLRMFGSWDWKPNRAGLQWFLDEVWPGLEGDVRCEIAGTGTEWVGDHALPGVEVVGRVPDLPGFLAGARAVAVPVRDGVGAPVKYAEALASGVPVVATTDGAPLRHDLAALVSDDAAEWRAWLSANVASDGPPGIRAAPARATVLAELSWTAASAPLLAWVAEPSAPARRA